MSEVLHAGGRYAALAHRFEVHTSDPALASFLRRLLGALQTTEPPDHVYAVVDRGQGAARRFELALDGVVVADIGTAASVIDNVLWRVNAAARTSVPNLALVHAAVAEVDGRAVLVPGTAGAGKTTLVAGLVRAGARYVSDELAAIDPETGALIPYPKPLTIEGTSRDTLADLAPPPDACLAPYVEERWYVAPAALGPVAPTPPLPAMILKAQYRPGAGFELAPLPRAAAVVALCDNSFESGFDRRAAFHAMAAAVRRSVCHQVTYDDLDRVARAVVAMLAGPLGRGTRK